MKDPVLKIVFFNQFLQLLPFDIIEPNTDAWNHHLFVLVRVPSDFATMGIRTASSFMCRFQTLLFETVRFTFTIGFRQKILKDVVFNGWWDAICF